MSLTKAMTIHLGDSEIEAEVEYVMTKYTPKVITADPYYSSPAEGGEVTILKVEHHTESLNEGPVTVDLLACLPKGEEERLEEMIFEEEVGL